MIKNVTILGERCSGTNYLENLININFKTEITWEYGWKHFFGFNDFKNSDNTLFIGIVRDPYDWINSFYRERHHLPKQYRILNTFLYKEIYSVNDNVSNLEIIEDRNIYTKERYKNIFELRHTKLQFLIKDMPKLVKHYILIKYEDLLTNFNETMNKIKIKGLNLKTEILTNTLLYRWDKSLWFDKSVTKPCHISREIVSSNINMLYETELGYII
uniref:Sulfotransferase domain-containing protein n=1 Tax=viral metagenome TaxID=1070528 RepID=A0A6C0B000_9ZZZZ